MSRTPFFNDWDYYGRLGVQALEKYTPVDSGQTAQSWDYVITRTRGKTQITWVNSNVNEGVNIAIILQYGHATRSGTYVDGRDYINPAVRPIFDKLAEDLWKKVKNG